MTQDRYVTVRSQNIKGIPVRVPSKAELEESLQVGLSATDGWTKSRRVRLENATTVLVNDLGLSAAALGSLAADGHIEVSVPTGDAAATNVPWEALLARSTASLRGDNTLVVTRQLEVDPVSGWSPAERRLVVITSAPRWLNNYSFDDETMLVSHGLMLDDESISHVSNPNSSTRIEAARFIHVTGVDSRQGTSIHGTLTGAGRTLGPVPEIFRESGLILSSTTSNNGMEVIGSEKFAHQLCPDLAPRPLFAAFNFFNSVEFAAGAVKRGVGAALGFVSAIDDAAAEVLFASFYRALGRGDSLSGVVRAFDSAWRHVCREELQRFVGDGVVLWTAQSMVGPARSPWDLTSSPGAASPRTPEERLQLRAVPELKLNYAMLHNGFPVFHDLRILSMSQEPVRDVQIRARISLGNTNYEYVEHGDIDSPVTNLRRRVKFPLTSSLARSLRESVRTSVTVEVSVGRVPVRVITEEVSILAVNEWNDRPIARTLLPSFVLSRDPSVALLVADSFAYLRAITDCRRASFVGYGNAKWNPPTKSDQVYAQARAIWACLVQRVGIDYIRPPPVYTSQSQRIRFPSEILRSGHATCLDLSLLFAACLEYIDLKPVLLLSERHASVGVWANDERYLRFKAEALGEGLVHPTQRLRDWGMSLPYVVDVAQTRLPDLIHIEMTFVTEHGNADCSFKDATNHPPVPGAMLIDVGLARDCDVTPLPLDVLGEHDSDRPR